MYIKIERERDNRDKESTCIKEGGREGGEGEEKERGRGGRGGEKERGRGGRGEEKERGRGGRGGEREREGVLYLS